MIFPNKPFVLIGNAISIFGKESLIVQAASVVVEDCVPTAEAVAKLALKDYLAGRILPIEQVLPRYVRNKVAKTIQERAAHAI